MIMDDLYNNNKRILTELAHHIPPYKWLQLIYSNLITTTLESLLLHHRLNCQSNLSCDVKGLGLYFDWERWGLLRYCDVQPFYCCMLVTQELQSFRCIGSPQLLVQMLSSSRDSHLQVTCWSICNQDQIFDQPKITMQFWGHLNPLIGSYKGGDTSCKHFYVQVTTLCLTCSSLPPFPPSPAFQKVCPCLIS